MNNKEKYNIFIRTTYIPIFSQPWWLDAVSGEDNWDVWLYEKGDEIWAAMPYHLEKRGGYAYITKPKLTQNNGIIINYPNGQKNYTKESFEEKIINSAMDFIDSLNIDVYEQQYHYNFINWIPFYWRNCSSLVRYTYVIDTKVGLEKIFEDFSPNCRKNIRKGLKNSFISEDISYEEFFYEHEKIFKKQNLDVPFPFELWEKLYLTCIKHECGKLLCTRNIDGYITSLMFIVWDQNSLYPLLGGVIPKFSNLQSYPFLTYESIRIAYDKGLNYDFEGSVIKRINHSFREFGGIPQKYYRIRKIYNREIAIKEANEQMDRVSGEGKGLKTCNL